MSKQDRSFEEWFSSEDRWAKACRTRIKNEDDSLRENLVSAIQCAYAAGLEEGERRK